jgi:ribosome-binding protein aMBF1 (putative translation factor)
MITGAQIRQARQLLGWSHFQLSQHAKLHPAIVERAERATGAMPITAYQLALLREALESAGVEFTNGDAPGVKLKQSQSKDEDTHPLG